MKTAEDKFAYAHERFADVQILRYRLNGFDKLSLRQQLYAYYLSEAALCGRDIVTDQNGRYNLRIRRLLESVYTQYSGNRHDEQFLSLETYLKRLWFSNGIYHHYGCEKFAPGFLEDFLRDAVAKLSPEQLPLKVGETPVGMCEELFPIIFDPNILPKRVNKAEGDDLVMTSACNYYEGVSQQEIEDFYGRMKQDNDPERPSYGLNSRLVKTADGLQERVWKTDGLYGEALSQVVSWLEKAREVAENDRQRHLIELFIRYYQTGDLRLFDQYSIAWVRETEGQVDFINGFIEVYGDPLGLKASWEGLVEYRDMEATRRAQLISSHAQWFEDHSPVDSRFRKPVVKGVTASVICAAMLGGDEYPYQSSECRLDTSQARIEEHYHLEYY